MTTLSVQTDIKAAIGTLDLLREDIQSRAIPRALNAVAAQVRTQAAREIRDSGYKIKIADIKKKLRIDRAKAGQPQAAVIAVGKPQPLIDLNARQGSAGVTFTGLNGEELRQSAFIITTRRGHRGVFLRTGNAHRKVTGKGKTYWSGLPIKEQFGPSIPDAFIQTKVQTVLTTLVKERFPRLLYRELQRLDGKPA